MTFKSCRKCKVKRQKSNGAGMICMTQDCENFGKNQEGVVIIEDSVLTDQEAKRMHVIEKASMADDIKKLIEEEKARYSGEGNKPIRDAFDRLNNKMQSQTIEQIKEEWEKELEYILRELRLTIEMYGNAKVMDKENNNRPIEEITYVSRLAAQNATLHMTNIEEKCVKLRLFIKQLLQKQREEIVGEIEYGRYAKVAEDTWTEANIVGYKTAVEDIINSIKNK